MTNNINANTDIKEILKQVSIKGLFDVKLTEEEEKLALLGAMATPFGTYYIESSKGKSSGCDTQVDQTSVIETSQSLEEKAIKACNGLKNDLKFEGTSNLKDVSTAKSSDILSEEQEKGGRSR